MAREIYTDSANATLIVSILELTLGAISNDIIDRRIDEWDGFIRFSDGRGIIICANSWCWE